MLLSAGLAIYVLFTWWLLEEGYMRATYSAYGQLMLIWVVGFLALLWWPDRARDSEQQAIILSRAVWCNLGVVAIAALIPSPVRLLLLAVPMLGVLYAALHLARAQVVLVAGMSWLVYLVCSTSVAQFTQYDVQLELMSALGFAAILCGGGLICWEIIRIRDRLAQRNHHLREAMEQMQELALKDELTQVHNRRYILEVLQRQKSLADRGQAPFMLCYCDLDHFKQINDKYGHAVGDAMLKEFASLACSVVRNVDYVARYGDEEFLLVLVDADEAESRRVATRLADRTRQVWLPSTSTDEVMTVSVGITRYQRGERVEDLLNRADRALYEAKMAGRDRVVVSSRLDSVKQTQTA